MLTELVRDFLDPAVFYQQLKNKGIDFYCGVPDSLLKGIPCTCSLAQKDTLLARTLNS